MLPAQYVVIGIEAMGNFSMFVLCHDENMNLGFLMSVGRVNTLWQTLATAQGGMLRAFGNLFESRCLTWKHLAFSIACHTAFFTRMHFQSNPTFAHNHKLSQVIQRMKLEYRSTIRWFRGQQDPTESALLFGVCSRLLEDQTGFSLIPPSMKRAMCHLAICQMVTNNSSINTWNP